MLVRGRDEQLDAGRTAGGRAPSVDHCLAAVRSSVDATTAFEVGGCGPGWAVPAQLSDQRVRNREVEGAVSKGVYGYRSPKPGHRR